MNVVQVEMSRNNDYLHFELVLKPHSAFRICKKTALYFASFFLEGGGTSRIFQKTRQIRKFLKFSPFMFRCFQNNFVKI